MKENLLKGILIKEEMVKVNLQEEDQMVEKEWNEEQVNPIICSKTRTERFLCSLWGKSFAQRSYLLSWCHRLMEKRFPYPLCSKEFAHKEGLKNHRHSQTGERPFCLFVLQHIIHQEW